MLSEEGGQRFRNKWRMECQRVLRNFPAAGTSATLTLVEFALVPALSTVHSLSNCVWTQSMVFSSTRTDWL